MILSIGEILADMVGLTENGTLTFKAFAGGAPFNAVVNAKQAGAKAAFVGRVGNDVIGRFLLDETKKAKLDRLDIQVDKKRNTTLAFVTLTNGERDFAFNRHDTADFNVDFDEIDFSSYENLNVLHLGSLMLSEENGVAFANKVANKTNELGVKLSFDVNFRTDIFKDVEAAKAAYLPFIDRADILKFSDDELKLFTGIDDVDTAAKTFAKDGKLILVTLGKNGSYYLYNGASGIVPTAPVTPVDTTGAGDAFFGTLLAGIEGVELTPETIESALVKANKKGAETTQFMGAIKL